MHAVVVFHHWNAESRNAQLARLLAWFGLTVVEIAMPYHLERKDPAHRMRIICSALILAGLSSQCAKR